MSTFFAPIVGETVRSDSGGGNGGGDWVNGRWQPGGRTGRASLHDVHLRPSAVQEEAPPAPVQVPQYAQPYAPTYDAPQQASNFTQQEGNMGGALSTYEQMPGLDEEDFDPFDREQMGAFIQKQVQSALAPSRQQKNDAELAGQYNRAVEKYGEDGHFKEAMTAALEQCIRDSQAGRSINIEQAYEEASESLSSRPGQKGSHLPARSRTVRDLGKILDYNNRTGRARPYRGR